MTWTSPKTWHVDEVLTHTDLNTYVRDNELIFSRATTYTPSWTASGTNPNIGNGQLDGHYSLMQNWCFFTIQLTTGTTTTKGWGMYTLSLPQDAAALSPSAEITAAGFIGRAGIANYGAIAVILNGTNDIVLTDPSPWNAGTASVWTDGVPFDFSGTNHYVTMSGSYRIG